MLARTALLSLALALALLPSSSALADDPPAPPADAGKEGDDDASRWPLEIENADARVIVYQPQVEALKGDVLTGYAAVSVARPPAAEPVFGAIWLRAKLEIDRDERTATPVKIEVEKARFEGAKDEQLAKLKSAVEQALAGERHAIDLDDLLAGLAAAQREAAGPQALKNDPPRIVFRDRPSVLLLCDGPPRTREAGGGVSRVMNTPFFLAEKGGKYFLLVGLYWWSAPAFEGPWEVLDAPPSDIAAAEEKEPRPTDLDPEPAGASPGGRPEVIPATEPTELIVTSGAPRWEPVPSTDLLFVANTDAAVFKDMGTQASYVLISGRWFTSKSLEGPWTFVAGDALPPTFAKIPSGTPKAEVLVSVPGTREADEAVADAAIPETAAVSRTGTALIVTYDGDPRWVACEGAPGVEYAENTQFAVFQVKGKFYCCNNAVWFEAPDPAGPWQVATSVPDEIYQIQPSCPSYSSRYVQVYESTDDVVYTGYYPGYTGCYVYNGCIVYGTGWWYRGWCGRWYYPRPCTYGMAVRYNPYTGAWGVAAGGAVVHGPNGNWTAVGVGGGTRFWGGGLGFRYPDVNYARNLRGDRIANRLGGSLYNQRPERLTGRSRSRAEAAGAAAGAGVGAQSAPSRPGVAVGQRVKNDVFADRDGNVFRRGDAGWERRDAKGWQGAAPGAQPAPAAPRPAPSRPEPPRRPDPPARPEPRREAPQRAPSEYLQRQSEARARGQQRVGGYQGMRGGGGARGGGGRGGGRR